MPALIFLVIATAGGNLFGFLSQLAYNSGILSKFANGKSERSLAIQNNVPQSTLLSSKSLPIHLF